MSTKYLQPTSCSITEISELKEDHEEGKGSFPLDPPFKKILEITTAIEQGTETKGIRKEGKKAIFVKR